MTLETHFSSGLSSLAFQEPTELSSFSPLFSDDFSNSSSGSSKSQSPPGLLATGYKMAPAMRAAYLTIGTVGIIGNLQVTVVMFSYRPMRRRLANYFLANQCIIDLVLSIIVILMYTVNPVIVPGILGELTCRIWTSKSMFLGLFAASLFSIVGLTVERYTEIVYPIQHKLRLTPRLVAITLFVINMAGIGFKMTFVTSFSGLVNGVCFSGRYPNFYVKKAIGVTTICLEFFLPLAVIGYCYVGMALSLHRKVQPMSGRTWNHARKNILKTLLFVVLVFVVCTTFKQIVTLLFFLEDTLNSSISDALFNVSTLMAYSNCCFNPLVYFFKYEEFQRGIRWLYCRNSRTRNRSVLPESNERRTASERY